MTPEEFERMKCAVVAVGQFQYTFGEPVPIGYMNAAVNKFHLRAQLISEEFVEFLEARDRVEQLDAVCDSLYVAIGGHLTCGFRMPEMENFGFNQPLAKAVGEARTQLMAQPCELGLRNKLASLCVTWLRTGESMFGPIKFNGAFNAVHENNMEKLWTEEEVKAADPKSISYVEVIATGKDPNRRFRVTNGIGKIIKPPGHKKVDLTPYV